MTSQAHPKFTMASTKITDSFLQKAAAALMNSMAGEIEEEELEEIVEAKVKTPDTPIDRRFPNQNQAQHCWYDKASPVNMLKSL